MQSLVSLKWATDYFTLSRPKAEEWEIASDRERQQYLNWASVLITSAFVFQKDIEVENNERIRIAVCEQRCRKKNEDYIKLFDELSKRFDLEE